MDSSKLAHLLSAARAVSPDCDVRFRGTADEEKWVCLISVGAAILFESKPGPLEDVVDFATAKLKGVSKRMLAALDGEPPSEKKP